MQLTYDLVVSHKQYAGHYYNFLINGTVLIIISQFFERFVSV